MTALRQATNDLPDGSQGTRRGVETAVHERTAPALPVGVGAALYGLKARPAPNFESRNALAEVAWV